MVRTASRQAGDWSAPIWQPLFSFPDKARGWLANIHPNALLREAGWICWCYYTTIRAKRKVAGPKACHFWKPEKKLRLILRQD